MKIIIFSQVNFILVLETEKKVKLMNNGNMKRRRIETTPREKAYNVCARITGNVSIVSM